MRRFIPLGLPQNAIKIVGRPQDFVVSPLAQILATNKDRTEAVISPGARVQSSIITTHHIDNHDRWLFRRDIILAQRTEVSLEDAESATQTQTVVAAPNGLYRVDIGYGSQFVCDPSKLMGTLGPIKAHIVFPESRFDVAKFWASHLLRSTVSGTRFLWSGVVRSTMYLSSWISKLIAKVQPHSGAKPFQFPALPKLPPSFLDFYRHTTAFAKRGYVRTSAKIFYWSHPKKLLIEGPTSILLRP